MRESEVESRLRKAVIAAGGICYKFVSPGMRGVPDRIVVAPGGRIWFIELKCAGKNADAIQIRRQSELRNLGFSVLILAGINEVNEFIKNELQ